MIDVLGLDGGLHGVLENLGEVILKVGSAEVDKDLLPVGGRVVLAEVGLHLASKDLEGGTLADAVGADEAKDLTGTGHGKTMELEGVGAVSVGGVALQILGEVDDGNGLEGALLDADTTSWLVKRSKLNGERRGEDNMRPVVGGGAWSRQRTNLLPRTTALIIDQHMQKAREQQ